MLNVCVHGVILSSQQLDEAVVTTPILHFTAEVTEASIKSPRVAQLDSNMSLTAE